MQTHSGVNEHIIFLSHRRPTGLEDAAGPIVWGSQAALVFF